MTSRGSNLGSAVCDWNTTAYSLAAPNRQGSQGNVEKHLVTNQQLCEPEGAFVTLRFGLILKMLVILIQFWATGRTHASEVSSCVTPCLSVGEDTGHCESRTLRTGCLLATCSTVT